MGPQRRTATLAYMTSKTLDISIPHQLGRDEARRRIIHGVAQARAQHAGSFASVEERWSGDRLDFSVSALGQRVAGWLDVQEQAVQIHVALPWLLAKLAERLRPQIEGEARKVLKLPPPAH